MVDFDPDHVRAQFEFAKWQSDKGKITLAQIYHTLDSLLEIEECLTCSKERVAFPAELEEVEKALKSYKGKADTTPKRHSSFDEDSGFYLR